MWGCTVLAYHLIHVSVDGIHWNSGSSCWGLDRVFCPSQPVTLVSSPPTPTALWGSGAHPWIIICHQGTSGCPHDTQVLREFSWLNSSPCCHHQAARKREVGLRRLSITPSFSSSKTCLLKPPLGSLIFAWLYISGDIWTEIARKRL